MANVSARMRRIASDWEQIRKDFAGHKNIIVTPAGGDPPEQYHITYFVNGIYLLPDGRIETLARHEVDIILHSDYPRYKPICKISTPIWHPNFRDGQICIGDIWGAGESLTDIIINIGDMIQYKSWNSSSPLSADAADWAIQNKHLFPVGNIDLHIADYASAADSVEIDIEGEENKAPSTDNEESTESETYVAPNDSAVLFTTPVVTKSDSGNDFDITAEELAGIEFVPTAQRMQSTSQNGMVKGGKINFKTILTKGLLWALIGAILGFGISEFLSGNIESSSSIAKMCGYNKLAQYYEIKEKSDKAYEKVDVYFKDYCKKNNLDSDDPDSFAEFFDGDISTAAENAVTYWHGLYQDADDAFYDAYEHDFNSSETRLEEGIKKVTRIGTAVWSATIALFIGLFLGLGEGIYYGSKEKAWKNALIGAVISVVIGYISGYIAQAMYGNQISDTSSDFNAAFIRAVGWALMGIGVGLAIGLIKPEKKRILFCTIGGTAGAFIGGFMFNYICDIVSNDMVARAIALVVMGALIGVGVGLLEQFAKAAWLKVIRGEFEGKEYLVFAGTTSIGNNGKNNIVLFKDKLVAPHHCDIILEGSKYILVDCGSPMGTVVNGMRTTRHILKQGDAIAVGNSVLVFNTK